VDRGVEMAPGGAVGGGCMRSQRRRAANRGRWHDMGDAVRRG
jgi:hypothetical protein